MRIGPLKCLKSNDYGRKWKKKHKENKTHAKTIELYVQKCDNGYRFAPVKRSKRTKQLWIRRLY